MKTGHLFLIFFIGTVVLTAGCVSTDQYQALENRLAAVEMEQTRQISTAREQQKKDEQMESTVTDLTALARKNETDINEHYADTMVQIEELKTEIRRLKGLIEETNYTVRQAGFQNTETVEKTLARLDNAITRNFEKLIVLEKYMGFEPTATHPPTGDQTAGPPPLIPETPEQDASESELYASAKKLLDNGDRENARIQFENFINRFPDSKNADNARFWIADSFYTDKWFEKAILEYQKVLEQYPDSNKTAAALLKQGYAFAELGEKANARLILKELIKKHPESNEAKYAAEKLKTLN